MLSLNEQEEIINDVLDVTEVNDKIREMENKCQNVDFDNINIAFKHSISREHIIGQKKSLIILFVKHVVS